MLSSFDDYFVHQTPEPVLIPATTDRNSYARFWFNGYSTDGEVYFAISFARYPNLGIQDGAFSLVIDGEQHCFFTSRRSAPDPAEMTIGPMTLDIIEPMKSLRVTIDDNDTAISVDLEWIPRTCSFAEAFQRTERSPGTSNQMVSTRFNQFGYWKGEINYGSHSLKVDPSRFLGTKDRSWGVRRVGDPAPPGAAPTKAPQIFFLWTPLQWDDHITHAGVFEDEIGRKWHQDAVMMPAYDSPDDLPGIEDPDTETLVDVHHKIDFVPGTRRARKVELGLTRASGEQLEIELECGLVFLMKGIGYHHPTWGHGKWKGELAIGSESWRCDEVDPHALENQHIQSVVTAKRGDLSGVGVAEQIMLGPHTRYGFKEFLDFAPGTAQ